jgi:signal transduction histidine kinase
MAWAAGRDTFERRSLLWCAAYGAFALAFLLASMTTRFAAWRPAALALQSVAALVVLTLGHTGFEGALLCVVAGEAPLLVGEKTGIFWLFGQMAGMTAVDVLGPFHGRGRAFSAIAFAGFQVFAFGASRLAVREAQARSDLARVHAELLATRELFADSTRTAERLRISRELHDALGHHLTALIVQLELARNLAEGSVKGPLDHAHAVAKELLEEVRSVVSAMREDGQLDLARALRALASGVPHPRIHLDIENDLRVEPVLAHAIFRCVQEGLTNAVRHAAAENVYLAVEIKGDTVAVTVRDDGRGATQVRLGHGLSGLRERIEGIGGRVEIQAQAGSGLTLRALLPARGAHL